MLVEEVLSQHIEGAGFLWEQRDVGVRAPHWSLEDLVKCDGRIGAHLDGIQIYGDAGWHLIQEGLKSPGPGEIFTASLAAFALASSERVREVLQVSCEDVKLARGFVASLGWVSDDEARRFIDQLLQGGPLAFRLVGLAGAATRRIDLGSVLPRMVEDPEPSVRTRALRAMGELGRLDLLELAERQINSEDPEIRSAAAWAVVLLSTSPEALSILAGTVADPEGPRRERALHTVMRRAEIGAAKTWLHRLAQDSATLGLATQGAGAIGDPTEVPWLIEQMKFPGLARVAGEAFSTITGVDIAYDDLEGERPDGFESGPTEDPADENVELDPDENLPWPDSQLIQKWWQTHRHAFQPGTRYLLGKPITVDWCKQVLRIGKQRQRAAAALELAMRQPGTPLFEVRARGVRQKQMLSL